MEKFSKSNGTFGTQNYRQCFIKVYVAYGLHVKTTRLTDYDYLLLL